MKNEQPLTSLDEMDGGGGEGGREDARPQGQLQLGTTHFKISSSESNVVNCFGFLLGGSKVGAMVINIRMNMVMIHTVVLETEATHGLGI